MFREERVKTIVDLISSKKRVSVNELADFLDVSAVTIRKDLDWLEKENLIVRTFGGAVMSDNLINEFEYEEKKTHNRQAKMIIADKAKDIIKKETSVFLDAGTTIYQFILNANYNNDVNFFTYDLLVALELAKQKKSNIHIFGGEIDVNMFSTHGNNTIYELKNRHFDLAMIACDAFDNEKMYASSEYRGLIKKTIIENSEKIVLLADSSKFSKKSHYVFGETKDVDCIISEKDELDFGIV